MTTIGVGIGWQRGDAWAAASLALLQPQGWFNWIFDHMTDESYLPMAYSLYESYADRYIDAALAQPGKLWLLGNEPELGGTATTPLEAKTFAERWQAEVGGEWAGFGTIVTDHGLAWLDEYLAIGGPIPTHWQIHLYWTVDAIGWVSEWRRWVRWMRANNVVRPTIITETNLYQNVDISDAKHLAEQIGVLDKVMDDTLPDTDLLHSLLWYSDKDFWEAWPWSDLRRDDGSLTPLGVHFVALMTGAGGVGEPPDLPPGEPPDLPPIEQPPPPHATWLPSVYRQGES